MNKLPWVVVGFDTSNTPLVLDWAEPPTEFETNTADIAGEAVAWAVCCVANPPVDTVPVHTAAEGQHATWPTASIAQNALLGQQ
jgi:hypothetical protein